MEDLAALYSKFVMFSLENDIVTTMVKYLSSHKSKFFNDYLTLHVSKASFNLYLQVLIHALKS